MSYTGLLNTTCTIRRFTESATDAHGQPTGSWGDLATSVKCRLTPNFRGGKEIQRGVQVVVSNHVLFLPAGQDVTEKDRAVVNSKTYEVLLVSDSGGMGHHIQADLELVA